MAINSKSKGNKNERELCNWWKDWSGLEFSRVPASGGLRWKKKDDITGDVIMTDERHSRRFPFSIEAKSYKDIKFEALLLGTKKNKLIDFWEQAKEDGNRGNKLPILFMRYNGMPKSTWYTCITLPVFKIMKKDPNFKPKAVIQFTLEDGETIIMLNSTDITTIDYKQFIIAVKKHRRNVK